MKPVLVLENDSMADNKNITTPPGQTQFLAAHHFCKRCGKAEKTVNSPDKSPRRRSALESG